MENFVPTHLQEIIYSSSDKKVRKQIAMLESTGKIKKIAPRIFTSNFIDTDEIIIKRNLFSILG
ncbi:MAG: Fic family protein, partial [Lutibacter sp.]